MTNGSANVFDLRDDQSGCDVYARHDDEHKSSHHVYGLGVDDVKRCSTDEHAQQLNPADAGKHGSCVGKQAGQQSAISNVLLVTISTLHM